jgi:hypothetical protein
VSLSVVTIVSQAVRLKYPIAAVLESVAPIADEIVVNIDTSHDDGTWQLVFEKLSRILAVKQAQGLPLSERMHYGRIVESPWNWEARDAGQELARQTNRAFEACTKDWILYIQADEAVHEDDYEDIRWILDLPEEFTAAEFMRLYFFGSPTVLRKDWTQPLVRMFRRGKARSVGDAMNCEADGLVWFHTDGTPRLFHYTRVADAETIGRRIRNLDALFHAPEELDDERPYDFRLRDVDGHLKGRDARLPQKNPKDVLVPYLDTHPAVMLKWLKENR